MLLVCWIQTDYVENVVAISPSVCRQQSPLLEWRLMYKRWALSFHWQWPASLSFYIIMSSQWLVASASHYSLLEHKLQKIYLFWATLLLVKQFFLCFGNHFQLSCHQCITHQKTWIFRLYKSLYTFCMTFALTR